ncbi:MAG: type II secretion system protein [Piscirickettsiaceae bacterium]|nr:type II secretion system protein [Piscirickettsiaceae bacterium]
MKSNRGYSLIELSITLVILGLLASLVISYVQQKDESVKLDRQYNEALVLPIQQAIEGFIYANHRLPCPASSSNGFENCAIANGQVPYATLGLAQNFTNSAGITFDYEVYANANNTPPAVDAMAVNADLRSLIDRNRPFIDPETLPILKGTVLGHLNGLDICQAIANARSITVANPTDANNVFDPIVVVGSIIDNPDNEIAEIAGEQKKFLYKSVAYVLTDKGYDLYEDDDDYRIPIHFDALWSVLGCVYGESPTGHAHANTVNATEIMQQSMIDYKVQVELAADIAAADVAASTATLLNAIASVATAAAALPIGTAQSILTAGAAAPSIGLSLAAIAAASLALTSAILLESDAIALEVAADDLVGIAAGLVNDITDIRNTVRLHMEQADAAGI